MNEKQQSTIRLGIADDNEQFRLTLRDIIAYESDIEVVGLWKNGSEVLMNIHEANPDILLLDINMPIMNGVETTKQLQKIAPSLRIIILSMHDDEGYVLETLKSGANGYLVKNGSGEEIVRAIREVAAGNAIVHPQVASTVLNQFQQRTLIDESWREVLTIREMDVLQELATGKTNEEIADALQITVKTVKNHVSSILSKLCVADRTQAVVVALKRRWLAS